MEITRRQFTTTTKSEGPKEDPYAVDIYAIDTNNISVTLRCGSLGYERLSVLDTSRGWVLEEFEIFTTPWKTVPHEYIDCLKPDCEPCKKQRDGEEMDRRLEHWTGLTRKQLLRISEKLEEQRRAADPLHGHDPYYGEV